MFIVRLTRKQLTFRFFAQFGLTRAYCKNYTVSSTPKVLANSTPKAGTNLLIGILYRSYCLRRKFSRTLTCRDLERTRRTLLRLKNGEMAVAHLRFDRNIQKILEELDIRHVLMIRDPRDVAISTLNYITYKDKFHELHNMFLEKFESDAERLHAVIVGISDADVPIGSKGLLSLGESTRQFLEWKNDPRCHIVRFEDLIGAEGGGEGEVQLKTIHGVFDYLGISLSEHEIETIAKTTFDRSSPTFHKGQIGLWRKYFDDEHVFAAKRQLDDLIEEFGYYW